VLVLLIYGMAIYAMTVLFLTYKEPRISDNPSVDYSLIEHSNVLHISRGRIDSMSS
jgi:hypothetical protein